jgi:hypothetical protein
MRVAFAAAGLLLALQAPAALACGHCVEDKIAAAYDHAAVTRALDRKHHVAFFHIDGTLAPGESTRRALEAIAESSEGVDKGSARVSVESASLAVAFDPRRTSFAAVQKALERKLAAKKVSLLPLRVMDRPAEMKTVNP